MNSSVQWKISLALTADIDYIDWEWCIWELLTKRWPIWNIVWLFVVFSVFTQKFSIKLTINCVGTWIRNRAPTTTRRDIDYIQTALVNTRSAHFTVHCDLLSVYEIDSRPKLLWNRGKFFSGQWCHCHCVKHSAFKRPEDAGEERAKMCQNRETSKWNNKHRIEKSKLAQISRILAFYKWLAQSFLPNCRRFIYPASKREMSKTWIVLCRSP